jgi:hypothetical protein
MGCLIETALSVAALEKRLTNKRLTNRLGPNRYGNTSSTESHHAVGGSFILSSRLDTNDPK